MAKLQRCEAGHVFDGEAHSRCPDCERLGAVESASVAAPQPETPTPAERRRLRPHFLIAGLVIPASWVIGAFAATAVTLTVGVLVLSPAKAPPPQPGDAPRLQAAVDPKITPQPEAPPPPAPLPPVQPSLLPVIPPPPPAPAPQLLPDPPRPPPYIPPAPREAPPFDPSKITLDKVGVIRSGWGALAYNPTTRNYGESWGYNSANQAQRRALAECGGESNGCQSAVWYRGKCGAIMAAPSGRWASGIGDSIALAVRDAYNDCTRSGVTSCELIRVNCTR